MNVHGNDLFHYCRVLAALCVDSVLNLQIYATLDVMLSSLCCLAIVLLIEKPKGPPPATPGHRPGRQVSEEHSLKRKREIVQNADPKFEESNVSKVREAKLTDRGATT